MRRITRGNKYWRLPEQELPVRDTASNGNDIMLLICTLNNPLADTPGSRSAVKDAMLNGAEKSLTKYQIYS